MTGIVILNYKTPQDVLKCVKSIEANTSGDYRIYMVDNNSQDNSVDVMRTISDGERIKLFVADKNGGYSYGNNIGAKEAISDKCENILFINPDVVVKRNAIDKLAEVLTENPKVAVVGPKIYDIAGNIFVYAKKGITFKQYLFLRKPFSILDGKKTIRTIHQKLDLTKGTVVFDGMVSGCCFMIRADVFEKIGLFDENMFLYYEEDGLWSRFSKLGYFCAVEPEAEVVHEHSASIGSTAGPFSRRCEEVGAFYYLRKYRDLKGIKLRFGMVFSKIMFIVISKVRKQNYKEQYELLKTEFEKIKKIGRKK